MEEKERYELFGEHCIKDNNSDARPQLFDAYVACVILNEQDQKIKELEVKLAERTKQLKIALKDFNDIQQESDKLAQQLAEERKKVVSELKVDIRSLFNSYASSLIDYCIWNKNADANQKLYNNFKRIINDRLVKVLDLFDKQINQIERGTDD